ncbi:MAG: hypothetical protein MUF38_06390 [Anaerolineae bacterium]|jgi:hypothetical protein|nr:hypothetical protein [Anaerolineae bacterium]
MAAVDVTASNVRPLNGAIIRRYAAASTNVAVGKVVYVKNDGTIELADKDAVGTSQARGIVVAIGVYGLTTVTAVGQPCDVVTHGPVELGNATDMTEGAPLYVADDGNIDETPSATTGDFNYIIGFAEKTSVLYVQGQMIVPTAV